MAIIDQDILRVSCNFELGDGTQYQNIYHFIRDGVDVYSDAAHITAISAKLQDAYADLVTFVKDDVVEKLSSVDRLEWSVPLGRWEVTENIGTFTITFSPIGTTDSLPFMSSPYVIFKTIRPKSVGKKFLFPMTEPAQANTILVAGAVTAIVDYAAEIMTAIALGGDATLTAGIPRTGFETWYNFLVAIVGDVMGSQKRRRPGVGA